MNRSLITPYLAALAVAVTVAATSASHAGGSTSWNQVAAILPKPTLDFIQKTLEVSAVGDGLRMGKHHGALAGSRIGPYTFQATSRLNEAEFSLTIETVADFIDPTGHGIASEGAPAGTRIVEHFVAMRLELVEEHCAEDTPVEAVRGVYQEVTELSLNHADYSFDGPESLNVKLGWAGSQIRKATVATGSDHGGSTTEVYYDDQGRPRFVLVMESYWRFVGDNQTLDTVRENRIYLDPGGQVVESLVKTFDGADQAALDAARSQAANRGLSIPTSVSTPIVAGAKSLLQIQNPPAAENTGWSFAEQIGALRDLK